MKSLVTFLFTIAVLCSFSSPKQEFSAEIRNKEQILDSLFTLLRASSQDLDYQKYNNLFILS